MQDNDLDTEAPAAGRNELAQRVADARARLPWQHDSALTEVLSEDELAEVRKLAEWKRAQDRKRDRRIIKAELGAEDKAIRARLAAEDKARAVAAQIQDADIDDHLTARKALAQQRRATSPHAKLANLYNHRSWSARGVLGVLVAGMVWSAINVQHNIAPGLGKGDALFWASYFIEAMISVCLIILMVVTPKADEWGVETSRGKIIGAEVALLGLTVGLNTFPFIRAGEKFETAVHAIPPIMIAVALLIHHAASDIYGQAIRKAAALVPDDSSPLQLTVTHRPAERIDLQAMTAGGPAALDTHSVAAPTHAPRTVDPQSTADPDAGAESAAGPAPQDESAAAETGAGFPTTEILEQELADRQAQRRAERTQYASVPAANPAVFPAGAVSSVDPVHDASTAPAAVPVARTTNLDGRTSAGEPAVVRAETRNAGARAGEGAAVVSGSAAPMTDWLEPAYELAAEIQRRGPAKTKSIEIVVQVVTATDNGLTVNAIEKMTSMSHNTIKGIRAALAEIRHEQAVARQEQLGGGRVIELRKS